MPVDDLAFNYFLKTKQFQNSKKKFKPIFQEIIMGVKKRVPSKTDQQPVAPSRETSVSDLGFTITGQLEVDFPEGMRKHCK